MQLFKNEEKRAKSISEEARKIQQQGCRNESHQAYTKADLPSSRYRCRSVIAVSMGAITHNSNQYA
jgi:hypothetical protein